MRRKDTKEEEKDRKANKPEAINLIASDTLQLSLFTAVNHVFLSAILKSFFSIFFLWRLLGWQSALASCFSTCLCTPVHSLLVSKQRQARKSLLVARDKKTKIVTEALHALRQIKFSALEGQLLISYLLFRLDSIL
jgi:hypothetical protein